MSQRPKTPTREITIGETDYRIFLLPPMGAGLETGAKLLALAAEPFAATVGAAGEAEENQAVGVERAIRALGDKVGSPQAVEIVRRLLSGAEVRVVGVDTGAETWRPLIDADLFGKYSVIGELVAFAVRENFADFFRAGPVADLLSAVKVQRQGPSKLPKE